MLILGFMVILGIFGGYRVGSAAKQDVYRTLTFLLHSERDVEAAQDIKILASLKQGRVDEAIEVMETRLKNGLKVEGITESTLAQARDYQRKYCISTCLEMK